MHSTKSLHPHPILDNPLSPRIIGGIRSGATRRFKSRHVNYSIVHFHHLGLPIREIAMRTGRCMAHCYNIISGKTKRCLTAAETRLLGPWKPGKFPAITGPNVNHSTELTYRQVSKVTHRKSTRKGWNWCAIGCEKEHRHLHSPYDRAVMAGKADAWWDDQTRYRPLFDAILCECGYWKLPRNQVCPMCGRAN